MPIESAREKFPWKGLRVEMTPKARQMFTQARTHSGVVVGYGRSLDLVSVRLDGYLHPHNWHCSHWNLDSNSRIFCKLISLAVRPGNAAEGEAALEKAIAIAHKANLKIQINRTRLLAMKKKLKRLHDEASHLEKQIREYEILIKATK